MPSSPYKLVRLDVTDQKLWLGTKEVDIGMGAAAVIKVGVFSFIKVVHNDM